MLRLAASWLVTVSMVVSGASEGFRCFTCIDIIIHAHVHVS
jgi:hypothetical protein